MNTKEEFKKNESIVDDYIMAFQDLYEYDDKDEEDFENENFKLSIFETIKYDDPDEEMSQEDMADIVADALYSWQYGDTCDADDLSEIEEDYYGRFPGGRSTRSVLKALD